jgi:hypothetical protein
LSFCRKNQDTFLIIKAGNKMKKSILATYILILAGLVFFAVEALWAAAVTAPPTDITINNTAYKNDTKGPVLFHHSKHSKDYKAACTECHHVYKDGKNVWKEGDDVQKCSVCHDPEKDQGKAVKLQAAFHNNCKDCHKKSGKDTAPSTKCNGCHAAKS